MDTKAHIETLSRKAANAEKSDDAMKFAQAALNLANAHAVLHNTR